jgi:hypothetical protein
MPVLLLVQDIKANGPIGIDIGMEKPYGKAAWEIRRGRRGRKSFIHKGGV